MITAGALIVGNSGAGSGGGGGATPGAPPTSVQFNNSGAFGGDVALTFDDTSKVFSVGDISLIGPGGQGLLGASAPGSMIMASLVTPAFEGIGGYGGLFLLESPVGGGAYDVALYGAVFATNIVSETKSAIVGTEGDAYATGAGPIGYLAGVSGFAQIQASSSSNISILASQLAAPNANLGSGTLGVNAGFYSYDQGRVTTTGVNAAFYAIPQGTDGSFDYLFWGDTPHGNSVYRINGSGIAALYNPLFSPKYTPNAANYERIIEGQWTASTNIAQIGTEAGGTGTLRNLQLIGAGVEIMGNVGFFATTPAAKQTVSGAKLPSDAVMASLLAALAAYGLVTDSTT